MGKFWIQSATSKGPKPLNLRMKQPRVNVLGRLVTWCFYINSKLNYYWKTCSNKKENGVVFKFRC